MTQRTSDRRDATASTLALFATVVLLLVALPVAVWLDLRELTQSTSRQQAHDIGTIITDIRGYYATDVVGRVLAVAAEGKPTLVVENYHDIPGAIPIPASFSIGLGQAIANRDSTIRYDFVSDFPFARREPYELTPFQRASLESFRADAKRTSAENVSGGMFDPVVQIACSSEQYGLVLPDEVPIRESNPLRPLSPYAASKRSGELMAHAFRDVHGSPVAILRFFTVYGPRGRPEPRPRAARSRAARSRAARSRAARTRPGSRVAHPRPAVRGPG